MAVRNEIELKSHCIDGPLTPQYLIKYSKQAKKNKQKKTNLSVSQQVRWRAGVEERGEDVANAALELPLKRRPPLGRVPLGAFDTSVGHAVW